MHLLKAWDFVQKSSFVCFALLIACFAKAQKVGSVTASISKPWFTEMTKAEFWTLDTLPLSNCSGCYCYSFTIVFSGWGPLKFGDVAGNKIPETFKKMVNSADSCTITFNNIKVSSKDGVRVSPPLTFKIK